MLHHCSHPEAEVEQTLEMQQSTQQLNNATPDHQRNHLRDDGNGCGVVVLCSSRRWERCRTSLTLLVHKLKGATEKTN